MSGLVELGLTSFLLGFTGAVVPGPLFVVVASEAPRVGARAGPIAASSHAALEAAMTCALVLGLSPILASELVRGLVSGIGGTAMLVFAATMIRGALRKEFSTEAVSEKNTHGPLLGGAVATALNPYWYLWWATIAASYFALSFPYGFLGVLAFYLGHISADLIWYSTVSALVAQGGRVLGERLNWLILACGLLLAFFGVQFLWLALGTLSQA